MSLFGKPKTSKVLKENKRAIGRNQRDLDREILTLEREEKKTIVEIKKLASSGQNASVKVMTKQLIRIRKQKEKILLLKVSLSSASSKATTAHVTGQMAQSMTGATAALATANAATPAPQLQKTMQAYQRQNEIADMKQEMMEDAFDMDEDEEEEGSDHELMLTAVDEAVEQVLDSIGLDVSSKLASAPSRNPLSSATKQSAHDKEVADLLASLN